MSGDISRKKRVFYLDLARALAILFMFTQHCMIIHEKTAGESGTLLGGIFVLLGTAPAAPVFMLIMGLFIDRSGETVLTGLTRGLRLIVLGYVLNALRFSIPLLIAGTETMIYAENESPLALLFSIDILQLAGLCYILLTLLKNLPRYKTILFVLIPAVVLISPQLWNEGGNILLRPFWGIEKNIYFPFFPWVIYSMIGAMGSNLFLNMEKPGQKRISLLIAVVCIAAGLLTFDLFPLGDYHRSGMAVHLLVTGFIFIWFPFISSISRQIDPEGSVHRLISFWSRNVTAIYFIQWILFGWSMLIFGANSQKDITAALIGLAVLLLTQLLVSQKRVRAIFSRV